MHPQMMNGMHPQQMHPSLQQLMQPNRGAMPQARPRDGPDNEPPAKRQRVALGANQGTSLLEAFSAEEIRTHLTMLRSRPGAAFLTRHFVQNTFREASCRALSCWRWTDVLVVQSLCDLA